MKTNKLKIIGRRLDQANSGILESESLNFKSSFVVGQPVREAGEEHLVELNDNDVVELVFDDNTYWYSNSFTLHELFPEALETSRDKDGVFIIPTKIYHKNIERGAIGSILLKAVNVFTKKAVHRGMRELAELLENKQLENKIGLYKLQDNFELIDFNDGIENASYFLFLHGTGSSTKGSFSELAGTTILKNIRAEFGANVIALNHQTISKNPLENVYDLMQALPAGATVDLISHSRGGLVGETFCRFCTDDFENAGFSADEMTVFKKAYPVDYYEKFKTQVDDLKKLQQEKKLKVRKFIRTACPAHGTTLASQRLDHFLNITFNLIGYSTGWSATPVYSAFKDLITSVIGSKNDVTSLPGLEAMDPASSYIKVINSPLAASINSPLMVIAGNSKASVTLKGLLVIASKLFYMHANDLVVDTESMYKGTKRTKLAQYFYDEGPDVNHFHYFKNETTKKAIISALQANGDTILPGFNVINQARSEEERGILGLQGGEVNYNKISGTKPILILIPGIMGSTLSREDELIWINYLKLISGDLRLLAIDEENIRATALIKTSYKKIADHLQANYDVVTYPYDWRMPLTETAKRLATDVDKWLSYKQPVKIIAHSMGGVLVRDFMVTQTETWKQLNASEHFRIIFLGSPLGGSFRIPAVLFGQDDLINKLSSIDIFHNKKELLQLFTKYPGILSLLPFTTDKGNDFALTDTWNKMAECQGEWPVPAKPDLDNFGRHRNNVLAINNQLDLRNAVYIAGKADSTPCGYEIEETANGKELIFLCTAEGDMSVTWDSGIPESMIDNNSVYYVNIEHGALANEPAIFRGIEELLESGKTTLISQNRPSVRGEDKIFRMPPQTNFDNSEEGLLAALMGTNNIKQRQTELPAVMVSISKGDLRYSSYPMMAGHFKNDGILFAEKAIDQSMGGALTKRHRLGIYPGDIGSSELFLNEMDHFKGGVIIGLGEVGALTSYELSKTVEQGVCKYLLHINTDKSSQKKQKPLFETTGISTVAVGCGFGGLTIDTSVRAVISGILEANSKTLKLLGENAKIIEHIEFIEQYEDKALGCFYTLSRIAAEENKTLNIICNTSKIKTLLGWKKRMPIDWNEDWWNRINIQSGSEDSLSFTIASNGARAEQEILYINKQIINELLKEISTDNRWSAETARAIFELLIPNNFKQTIKKQSNISWLVDKQTAAYPWELLQDGTSNSSPLCVNAGMIRQLSTSNYRALVSESVGNCALVIGDPLLNGFAPQLPGAAKEGQLVSSLLNTNGFESSVFLNAHSTEIIKSLFSKSYKIIHLAGHGAFSETLEQPSGMLIGNNVFLSTKEISQMSNVPELVFVNCCFLGKINGVVEAYFENRYKLAANIGTQLIDIGVKAVIVAGWAIDDAAAYDFTKTFYEHLFAGNNFGDSILEARRFVYDKYAMENNTWGAYQCYGDPYYRLQPNRTIRKNEQFRFLIAEEAEIELNNLHNELETNRFTEIDYLARLEAISSAIDTAGFRNQRITEKEAIIYTDLCNYDKAIEKFELLFSMERADFSVFSIEKYCNVRAKKYVKDLREKKTKPGVLYPKINQVIKDLENILRLSETGERYSLLGSAYKRKAFIAGAKEQKIKALEQAANYYIKAYKHENNTYNAYCLTNWYSLQTLLSLIGKHEWNENFEYQKKHYKLQSPKDASKQLYILKASLDKQADMDFWNLAAVASIKLCLLIIDPQKQKNTDGWDDVLLSFRNVWAYSGSKGKKIAEIEHLDIFIDGLSLSTKKEAKSLTLRLHLLREELRKLI